MDNLFTTLTQEEQVSLKYHHFKKGETIFHEDDKCENITIVISGRITISSFTYGGNEVIYNTLLAGQVFGNNLIFSSDPYYRGDVIAKEKSILVFIYKKQLKYLLKNNEQFLDHYLKIQSDFGKQLNAQIKMLSFDSAEERLFFFLKINNGKYFYHSVTDLSSILHLKRETLSRLLTRLSKEKKINLNRQKRYIEIFY